MTFTESGISILPYGFANRLYEIDVIVENGYIYDKRVIELFKLRNMNNQEIEAIGSICRNATFYYMIMCPAHDLEAEDRILQPFPQGAFYRSNLSRLFDK